MPHAPYVTSLPWISHYGCYYVVHGDDVTSDSGGEDCYRYVKAAGRFLVVKRTPGISTTDLVGRMLLCTRNHFIRSLQNVLTGKEGPGSVDERRKHGEEMSQRIKDYATDESGLQPGPSVFGWQASRSAKDGNIEAEAGAYTILVQGKPPKPGQRIVYVDGGFDLFSSGHIEFLRQVANTEEAIGRKNGWYDETLRLARETESGEDYGPAFIVAGVHDDEVINHWKGVNYPIMNIFERGLCVLQCKVSKLISLQFLFKLPKRLFLKLFRQASFIHTPSIYSFTNSLCSLPSPTVLTTASLPANIPIQYVSTLILGAPFTPSSPYLHSLPFGLPSVVYHGPTSFMPLTYDPYKAAKELGIYAEIREHEFQHVNAGEIVQRIMRSREMYEARQRAKAAKAVGEEDLRQNGG